MAEESEDEFRISIAGAQEKTALLWTDDGWHRPIGPTPTTHIFKLPIGKIEHSGMDLSESCETARIIVVEMMEAVEEVIARVEAQIPDGFPDAVATPILAGMCKQRDQYAGGLEKFHM